MKNYPCQNDSPAQFSILLIPVSFNFFLFLNTLFLLLYLANLMMIGLGCLPFLSLPIRSISISVSFSCKSSFKVSVTTVFVSSFSLSSTPSTKIQFLHKYCSCLSMTLFKSSILLSFFFVFSSSPLIFFSFSPIRQTFHCKIL